MTWTEKDIPSVDKLGLEGALEIPELCASVIKNRRLCVVKLPYGKFADWLRIDRTKRDNQCEQDTLEEELSLVKRYFSLAERAMVQLKQAFAVLANPLNQEQEVLEVINLGINFLTENINGQSEIMAPWEQCFLLKFLSHNYDREIWESLYNEPGNIVYPVLPSFEDSPYYLVRNDLRQQGQHFFVFNALVSDAGSLETWLRQSAQAGTHYKVVNFKKDDSNF